MDLLPVTTEGPGHHVVWRTRDVASFWQRTPATIWRWVEAGTHPAPLTDPGGSPYWLPEELHAFARGERTAAPTRHRSLRGDRGTAETDPPVFELVIGERRSP